MRLDGEGGALLDAISAFVKKDPAELLSSFCFVRIQPT